MSKRYQGLNFVDVVVTPAGVTHAPKKKRRVSVAFVVTFVMCVVILGVWAGRTMDIPFFYTAGYYIRQAITYDVWPGGGGGDSDGKLRFVAQWLEQAGLKI